MLRHEKLKVWYALTCAHNLVSINEQNRKDRRAFKRIMIYESRHGRKVYRRKYPVRKFAVHYKYNGDCHCGYDIGVCLLGEEIKGDQ